MKSDGTWSRRSENMIVLEVPSSRTGNAVMADDALLVAREIASGNRNETDLSNKVFYRRRPERRGKPILRHERALAKEWLSIRDILVRPALRQADTAATADRWLLPDAVRAVADRLHVAYDAAPEWADGRNCAQEFSPGADELGRYILANHPGVTHIAGYACRQNTADLPRTSVHGTGRAIDIMIPTTGGRASSAIGDPIANWLVLNAATIGVQYVIWNRMAWGGHYAASRHRPYRGPNPHIDHIHAEITITAAAKRTPWFAGEEREVDQGSELLHATTCSCGGCRPVTRTPHSRPARK